MDEDGMEGMEGMEGMDGWMDASMGMGWMDAWAWDAKAIEDHAESLKV